MKVDVIRVVGVLLSGISSSALCQATLPSVPPTPSSTDNSQGAALQVDPAASRAETPAAAASDGPALGDIVVTANKRSESINRVGLTITALSGEALAQRRISSLEDIARAVPGLDVSPSFAGTPILTLRGIGFNENSLGVYPAVSLYVDQAPLPFPVMTSHSAYDLERIEVLKGPQGTLFGQNSTGGAINYIAAKPTRDLTAGGSLSYGRFNEVEANAFISGPISDTLGFRVAANGRHMDDWQYSLTRDDTNGHISYIAARAILDWKPADAMSFSLNINGWKDRSQPQALQLIGVRPQAPAFAGNFYNNIIFAPNKARAADWTDQRLDPSTGIVNSATGVVQPGTSKLVTFDPKGNRRFYQIALRADIELTDDLTLTSLTSYDRYKQNQRIDPDGSESSSLNIQADNGNIKSFNQELRVANDPTHTFRWVVGANYENSKTSQYQLVRQFDTTAYNPGNLFLNASGVTVDQDIINYAFFASGELKLTNRLTAKIGGRYTNSKIDANTCSTTLPGGNVDTLFNLLGSVLGSVPFKPVGPNDCYTLNEQFVPGQPFVRTLHQNNASWRVGLDYQVTPATLLYTNISRGYKAGSFPALAAALYSGLEPVTQESVTSYEAGFKTQFLDRRATLTAAAFYYDYKDKQVRGKLADPIFGNLDALINIPKSRVYGAEAEFSVRPMTGFSISTSVTYLNSKIREYSGVNVVGTPNFNSAGDPLPFTPKWSGVVDVNYEARAEGATPFVGVTLAARSGAQAAISAKNIDYAGGVAAQVRPGVGCVYCIKGYATVDARLGYRADGARWSAWVWGRNIFNKYYWTTVISSYEAAARAAGMPATYGATLSFKL